MFYCLLDLSCGECNVVSLYFLFCSVNGYVCLVFDSVCEMFDKIIRNIFGCGCYFVVECYGCCTCDPSVHLDVHPIGFVYVCLCRNKSPHL